ncbi:uncharacterized protein PGTG_18827 [Puccinia graminis f. sp. tritici CRL 75-36-700-3]|uniref:Uncharacterized protein n=1 Tax=Puccinia graminis f. sp. tritici (strain CRL 75-36-700-3 / race SCCL) TaxID=418459 RepID=E3L7X4_PUCGT|nr:uncharacterized protein PGTG_18827 [Puccinia graminis f. sp. tritici CRL 75-36-700-3]EFP92649.1 hypothetical protein PGTG_18827 [Puccinia graminis f. sp. tritici CRL 75-36-700-3]
MARTKNTRRGKKKPQTVAENQEQESEQVLSEQKEANDKQTNADDPGELEKLIDQAERLLITSDFEQAKQLCQQALDAQNTHLRALETLALSELELGEIKSARKIFQKCLNHSKSNPPPTVHLYLAQLSNSPQEALGHFKKALDLLKNKLNQILLAKTNEELAQSNNDTIQKTTTQHTNQSNTVQWSIDESQIRRSCSRALVGMTEIYLTDLCFDPSAEEKCLEYLAMASSIDPTDPEPLQTLASVRLSQSETNLAKEALLLSWSLWRDKVPIPKRSLSGRYYQANEECMVDDEEEQGEDENENEEGDEEADRTMDSIDSKMIIAEEALIEEEQEEEHDGEIVLPPIDSRIQWAKLAIECEIWNSAIEVLHQCEAENDEDGEVEYLLAVSWFLLGQSRPAISNPDQSTSTIVEPKVGNPFSDFAVGDGLGRLECWLEAKECIETCLQLHERLGEDSGIDESILKHLNELKLELANGGLPIQSTNGEEKEAEELNEDEINDADWVDASDIEMG